MRLRTRAPVTIVVLAVLSAAAAPAGSESEQPTTRAGEGTSDVESSRVERVTPFARAFPESPAGSVAPLPERLGTRAGTQPTLTASARSAICDTVSIEIDGDGAYENAIGWQFEGVAAPDFGAMAQIYAGRRVLCGVILDLSQSGGRPSLGMDLYVWDDGGGVPGAVRAMVVGANPGVVATWPDVGRHLLALPEPSCAEVDSIWVGYRPSWEGERAGWFVGADLDGPPARSLTKIAPGLGFPTGWQSVTTAWGPLSALGIGLSVDACATEPVVSSSWGTLKTLFR